MSDNLVIINSNAIEHFQMARLIGALRLEVKGIKVGHGSLVNIIRRDYGFTGRQKKGALKFMEELYLETYGWEYGSKR